MASWINLPKELKWMILKHLVYECYKSYGYVSHEVDDRGFYKSCGTMYESNEILPRNLSMYRLFILLSLIDKQRFVGLIFFITDRF